MRGDEADIRWFGAEADLYPRVWRHDPSSRVYLDRRRDGSVSVRLAAESDLVEAVLLLSDTGGVTGLPMRAWGGDGQVTLWEVNLAGDRDRLRYSFALRTAGGEPVYITETGVANAVERLDRWEVEVAGLAPFDVPEWARGAVIYQIFPDRFANGDPGNDPPGTAGWADPPHWLRFQGGDLDGVREHLDHLEGMGVEVVYLNPIFTSPSTHRYDTVDYYEIDPALGGADALRRLVAAVHGRGMRLILDASFNHCHPRFFAFADVVANGPGSRYRDWFVIDEFPLRVRYRPHLVAQLSRHPNEYARFIQGLPDEIGIEVETVDGEGPLSEPNYEAWYGVPTMPRLNLSNGEARSYVLEVAKYWLAEFDLDGWRMDVARYVDRDVWPEFRQAVRSVKPEAYLLCEVMGDASAWLGGDSFDGTMNYTFRDLCVGYFAQRALSTERFLAGFTRMLASYPEPALEASQNLLSSHDTPRFLHVCGGDAGRVRAATAFLLTAPGAPSIYYGDEVGLSGGEDPGSRGTFPWHDPASWDEDLLELTRGLGTLRNEVAALRRGDWRAIWSGGDGLAFMRSRDDQRVLVVISRGAALPSFTVEIDEPRPELLWGSGSISAVDGTMTVDGVGPYGVAVARV